MPIVVISGVSGLSQIMKSELGNQIEFIRYRHKRLWRSSYKIVWIGVNKNIVRNMRKINQIHRQPLCRVKAK